MVQIRDNISLEIIQHLMHNENHVRGIAQQLDEPHSTISRRLKKLKSDNIVDAKVEGKNKVFFLKENLVSHSYILQSELYKLAKLIKKHPSMGIICQQILSVTDEPLIILFGSYAKGLEKQQSDIDIYIQTRNRATKKAVQEVHSKINVKIGPFDKQSPLIKEIIKDHIILRGVELFYEMLKT